CKISLDKQKQPLYTSDRRKQCLIKQIKLYILDKHFFAGLELFAL
ncbi:MAG: hypothetical protein ACD_74C00079G0004, partial [uncultured bacterium]